jgi:hypothetical protein
MFFLVLIPVVGVIEGREYAFKIYDIEICFSYYNRKLKINL